MTKKQIFSELNLTDDYIIHEYYENEKVIYVVVSKEKNPIQYTLGDDGDIPILNFGKWKKNGKWFNPTWEKKYLDFYKEIHNLKDISKELK